MKATSLVSLFVAVISIGLPAFSSDAQAQPPQVKIPEPGVPQLMTLQGTWTRVAYNNEGYTILGYRVANMSIGEEWMLIEFGATVRDGVPAYTLTRDALSLETPDGQKIPLAPLMEYRGVNLSMLDNREKVLSDSINYFPPSATQACRIGFFSELGQAVRSYDEVELASNRGCVGRLFFKVPGGIKYGQHWLNVKFEKSLVRVPFRILTKDEERLLSKDFKDIKKQVEEAFKTKS